MAIPSVPSTLGSLPHADGVISRLACARAKRPASPCSRCSKKANLTARQIDDPQRRLAARDQSVLNLVAEAVQDDLLGFHVAQECDLRELGLLYYVLASSDNVIEALRRAARYGAVANEACSSSSPSAGTIGIALQYVGVSRHLDRHQTECWMVLIVRLLRHLTGLRISPRGCASSTRGAGVPRSSPSYFGADVRFAALPTRSAFRGDRRATDCQRRSLPQQASDPVLRGHASPAVAPTRLDRALAENAIVPLLPHGEVRIGEIARRLGLGQRTLARRLSAEGLTFSRSSPACGSISRSAISPKETCRSRTSPGSWATRRCPPSRRRFKRWTGEGPAMAGCRAGAATSHVDGQEKGPGALILRGL
jgi:hypothetical protein